MIYIKRMTACERGIPRATAISAHRINKTITLDDVMAVTDDQAVTQGLPGGTSSFTDGGTLSSVPFIFSNHLTGPAPMDLSAISGQGFGPNRRDQNV